MIYKWNESKNITEKKRKKNQRANRLLAGINSLFKNIPGRKIFFFKNRGETLIH